MELPTSKLNSWAKLADLDFVLAHKVLEDRHYAEYFASRPLTRELILDNSMHELGSPLTVEELCEAAHRCRADYVVTPDKVGHIEFNLEQYLLARMTMPQYKMCVIMTIGQNFRETENFLFQVRDAHMLGLTFKEPLGQEEAQRNPSLRMSHYHASGLAKRWHRVHLFGVDSLAELDLWKAHANLDARSWSVDTAKCLKWAMQGKNLTELDSLRCADLSSHDLLSLRTEDISPEQERLFHINVQLLRRHL